jgi:voltage-gated potassium channel
VASDTPEKPTDSALRELFHSSERVPFIYWREFSGARMAVLLTSALAVLAFITGLSDLSQQVVRLNGPLAGLVPGDGSVVRLYAIFFSFVLAVAAAGLQRGLRLAWYGVVVALPLLALLPLTTGEATGVPLLLSTLVTFPLVVYHRDAFDKPLELSPFQITALAVFAGVQVYGTIGAYVLKEDYVGIETWTDAFYYIVVTGTTVGYGDATPVSQTTKLFTLSIIVTSTAAFGAVFGSLLVPALESRITSAFGNMTASELTLLEDHVLVLGYGDLTEPLLDQLAVDADVVVVTPDAETASGLRARDVSVLTADPTDEASLRDARIEAAQGVVAASDDDAQNTLAVLAARQVAPDIRVVAAANDPRHVDKLRGVGADEVVSPAVLGGRILGQSVLEERSPQVDEPDEASDEA